MIGNENNGKRKETIMRPTRATKARKTKSNDSLDRWKPHT
jgi:hypothetical protein